MAIAWNDASCKSGVKLVRVHIETRGLSLQKVHVAGERHDGEKSYIAAMCFVSQPALIVAEKWLCFFSTLHKHVKEGKSPGKGGNEPET